MVAKYLHKLNIQYDSSLSAQPEDTLPRVGVRHCFSSQGGWESVACSFDQKNQYPWDESEGGYPNYTVESLPKSNQLFMGYKYIDGKVVNVMDTVFGYCEQSCNVDQVKDIWMENFLNHYNHKDRPPYGIYLHRQSLSVQNEVDGLNKFIDEVKNKYPNTYFVTASKVNDYYKLGVDLSKDQLEKFLEKK